MALKVELFICILLILQNLKVSKAVTLTDITPLNQNDKYAEANSTGIFSCAFEYDLYIQRPESATNGMIINKTVPPSNILLISGTLYQAIYKVIINDLPIGNGGIVVTLVDGFITSEATINYVCEAPPNTGVSVTSLSNSIVPMYSSVFYSNPYILLKINGLSRSVAPALQVSLANPSPSQTFSKIEAKSIGSKVYKVDFILGSSLNWNDFLAPVLTLNIGYKNTANTFSSIQVGAFFNITQENVISDTILLGPTNSGKVVGPGAFVIHEIIKSNNEEVFITVNGMSDLIPTRPLKIMNFNDLQRDIFANKYITLYNQEYPQTLLSRTFINGTVVGQQIPINYDIPVVPTITKSFDSIEYDPVLSLVNMRFGTNMPVGVYYNTRGTVVFVDQYPHLYLAEGNSENYILEFSEYFLPWIPKFSVNYENRGSTSFSKDITISTTNNDFIAPKILSLNSSVIDDFLILNLRITDDLSGFHSIFNLGTYMNLISGNLTDGIYEFIIDFKKDPYILYTGYVSKDRAQNNSPLSPLNYITPSLDKLPNYWLDIDKITSVSFEFNTLDVSNEGKNNTFFIYYPSEFSFLKPQMLNYNPLTQNVGYVLGRYDDDIGAFKFPFHVHKNYIAGEFSFSFYSHNLNFFDSSILKNLFGSQAQLIITNTKGDRFGPIIEGIQTKSGKIVTIGNDPSTTNITWAIVIQDMVNGFKNGVIVIQSSLDFVEYSFEITLEKDLKDGDQFLGSYEIALPVNYRCKSQQFYFKSVTLYDQFSYMSHYFRGMENYLYSPFMYIDVDASSINTSCSYEPELIPPQLVSFDVNPKTIDVTYSGSFNDSVSPRLLTFNFETSDQSGILLNALPKIYLQDLGSDPISQAASLVSFNSTNAVYQCKFEVPFGFGYPEGFRISLYGIVDNQGNFKGYATNKLPVPKIDVIPFLNQNISILSTTELSINGGNLYIYGRQFQNYDRVVIYDNEMNFLEEKYAESSSNTLMPAYDIKSYNLEYLLIAIKRSINGASTIYSNRYKVYLKGYKTPSSSSEDGSGSSSGVSSSQDSLSSDSNIPTNSPQSCINLCSGHGDCTSRGCLCKSPWVGLDCSYQVIIIPPQINNTNPETNFTIPTIDGNGNTKKEVFYAIISIIGLNELDNNNNILNRYNFEKWIVSSNTNSKYSKYTNSTGFIYTTSLINLNDQTYTNLSVSIDYFNINQAINISFANQVLEMSPGSLKYSINITNYSFKSSLSSLQLVLSASLESNNDDECSSKQLGEVVGSESEFIKMQIDKNSLYGRFIKRGIIDNRVRYITNTLLDSEYNSVDTSSKSQTYIGINIPFYSKLAQLDPDFSVLVDSKPASENQNAICQKTKSKLSGPQIAGIVIGAVGFAAIIVISGTYYLYKKKKISIFKAQIQQKMNNLN